MLLGLDSGIHGCSLRGIHSTNLQAAKKTFALVEWYSILCQSKDHGVKAPLLAILEEMCLQSVVPGLNEVVSVNCSDRYALTITEHPSNLGTFFEIVLFVVVQQTDTSSIANAKLFQESQCLIFVGAIENATKLIENLRGTKDKMQR